MNCPRCRHFKDDKLRGLHCEKKGVVLVPPNARGNLAKRGKDLREEFRGSRPVFGSAAPMECYAPRI